jgi:DNA-binding transcriptional regulator YiaG
MRGAGARQIEDLNIRGGLKVSDIANSTGVSQATVSPWSAGLAAPQPSAQLVIVDLCAVVD